MRICARTWIGSTRSWLKKNEDRKLARELAELERRVEAEKAAQRREEALEGDRALLAARDAQRAAQGVLETAERQRAILAGMLDGSRDLATGRLKAPPGGHPRARLGTLPPRAGTQPTEAEIAREEHLAASCDADGHEIVSPPPPIRQDCESAGLDYDAERAAWLRVVDERERHVSASKRRIWEEGLPLRLDVLAAAQAEAGGGAWSARALDAARAALDWMRERVVTAISTLGRTLQTRAMEERWLESLADHLPAMDAVRADHEDQAKALRQQAGDVRSETVELHREVEREREVERIREAQARRHSGPSGPGM